jgi:hypothetical protein
LRDLIAGVRAMLADDVKLDLVSRWTRAGRREVAGYFTDYDSKNDWHLVPGWLDGREVIAVLRDPRETRPTEPVNSALFLFARRRCDLCQQSRTHFHTSTFLRQSRVDKSGRKARVPGRGPG